jgi:hypothetical protein
MSVPRMLDLILVIRRRSSSFWPLFKVIPQQIRLLPSSRVIPKSSTRQVRQRLGGSSIFRPKSLTIKANGGAP